MSKNVQELTKDFFESLSDEQKKGFVIFCVIGSGDKSMVYVDTNAKPQAAGMCFLRAEDVLNECKRDLIAHLGKGNEDAEEDTDDEVLGFLKKLKNKLEEATKEMSEKA